MLADLEENPLDATKALPSHILLIQLQTFALMFKTEGRQVRHGCHEIYGRGSEYFGRLD